MHRLPALALAALGAALLAVPIADARTGPFQEGVWNSGRKVTPSIAFELKNNRIPSFYAAVPIECDKPTVGEGDVVIVGGSSTGRAADVGRERRWRLRVDELYGGEFSLARLYLDGRGKKADARITLTVEVPAKDGLTATCQGRVDLAVSRKRGGSLQRPGR